MSITDELRKYARGYKLTLNRSYQTLMEIADRIDAAHERLCSRSRSNGYSDGFTDGFNDIESWVVDHEDEMAEHGWYRVVDADKQATKFNDNMEWELLGSGETESGYVVGIKIDLIAGRQSCRVKVVRDSDFQTIELMAKNLHHVKPAEPEPAVEDVLCELLDKVDDDRAGQAEIIAEYAAKLRLADGKEQQ